MTGVRVDSSREVRDDVFKDVKYFFIGSIPRSVEQLLSAGGGRKENYLSQLVTHVITDDGGDDYVTEAKDLFQLPVVKSSWVEMSAKCGSLLPTCVFDPDPKLMIFAGFVICPSQLSAVDNKIVWVLVTIYGGQYQTLLDKNVTHLITTETKGAKYTAACSRPGAVKVVTPDWIIDSVTATACADERRYNPSLLHSNTVHTKVTPVQEPAPPVSTEESSRPSQESSRAQNVSDIMSAAKALYTTNVMPFMPFPGGMTPLSAPSSLQARSHLQNIGNSSDLGSRQYKNSVKSVSHNKLNQHTQSLTHPSPSVRPVGVSNTETGGTESKTYYAHDPVPDDVCLLGCIFYIADYQKCLEPATIDMWKQVISLHGGQVDDSYSNRITHVLCEHQKSDVFQLALRDGKRLVTAHWLNDCLLAKRMSVPSYALHFPYIFGRERPCLNQIISITNFQGEERQRVKHMIALVGAKYTGYMSRANSVIIAKHLGGTKCQKAVEWSVPVVGVQWLSDIILGDLSALKLPVSPRYTTFNADNVFQIDLNRVSHLIGGWKFPVKISKEMWKKFQSSQVLKSSKMNTDNCAPCSHHLNGVGTSPLKKLRLSDTPKSSADHPNMPVVLITGFPRVKTAELSEKVAELGGQVVFSALDYCTHLVANSILRTVKFLTAVGVVHHIVTSDWVEQSSLAKCFLAEDQFQLRDEAMEMSFNFKLHETLKRAREKKLFQDFVFYFTPGVEPSKTLLAAIASSCGGRMVDSLPPFKEVKKCVNAKGESSFIVISCVEDIYLCQDIVAQGIPVHNAEFVLTGVMRQEVSYSAYRVT